MPCAWPDFSYELQAGGQVAGVDEAGCGPWAGPVVAAAVILTQKNIPEGIHDSKKLSAPVREALYAQLLACAHTGVGMASVAEIDRINILQARKLAMLRAVEALPLAPDVALVDGNHAPALACRVQLLVGGDALSLSIAAASIIAKVTRDRLMRELALDYPAYSWERNAGYGTRAHQEALAMHGVTVHHRRSFRPIRALLAAAEACQDAA